MQRINLFPNPDFKTTGRQPDLVQGVTPTMDSHGSLSIQATRSSLDSYAAFILSSLTPGSTLLFSFRVALNPDASQNCIQIMSNDYRFLAQIKIADTETHTTNVFTVPSDGILRIMFFPYRHDGASDVQSPRVFTRPQLELASTYTSNVEGGGEFFSGSTMPLD